MLNDLTEEIRQKSDIVQVVSHYIPINKKGRNYVGLCPFHNDSNPSFTVSPDKQIYKCFACNASGNVFTFVRDYEKISFPEAVIKVADLIGFAVPDKFKTLPKKNVPTAFEPLYGVVEEALKYYNYYLKTAEGVSGEAYLKGRQIPREIINEFEIGFAPLESQKTIAYLKSKNHSTDAMISAGLVFQTNSGMFDYMRGRVIFPIHDLDGHPVGFSGRRIVNSDEAKYVNTSETPIFRKGLCLYNYHRAEKIARRENYIYIVEGFMDAIALHRGGLPSVVATMGTATTIEHVQALKKLNVEIRIALDFDDAGQTATVKLLELLADLKVPVMIVKPPEKDQDADEILNEVGPLGLKQVYTNLLTPIDFLFQYFEKRTNLNNYQDRLKLAMSLIQLLQNESTGSINQEHYLRLIATKTGFSLDSLRRQIKTPSSQKFSRNRESFTFNKIISDLKYYEKIEREIIALMIRDQSLIQLVEEDINYEFYDEVSRQIAFYLYNLKDKPLEMGKIMNEIPNPKVHQFLGDLIENVPIQYSPEAFKRLLDNHHESVRIMAQIEEKSNELWGNVHDRQKQSQLLKEITALKQALVQIKRK